MLEHIQLYIENKHEQSPGVETSPLIIQLQCAGLFHEWEFRHLH